MIGGFLSGVYEAVKNWLFLIWGVVNDAFWWVLETCRLYFGQFIDYIIDHLPDGVAEIAESCKVAFSYADYWFALGDCCTWLVGYWTFALTFSCIKIIIKLIPTIG